MALFRCVALAVAMVMGAAETAVGHLRGAVTGVELQQAGFNSTYGHSGATLGLLSSRGRPGLDHQGISFGILTTGLRVTFGADQRSVGQAGRFSADSV